MRCGNKECIEGANIGIIMGVFIMFCIIVGFGLGYSSTSHEHTLEEACSIVREDD